MPSPSKECCENPENNVCKINKRCPLHHEYGCPCRHTPTGEGSPVAMMEKEQERISAMKKEVDDEIEASIRHNLIMGKIIEKGIPVPTDGGMEEIVGDLKNIADDYRGDPTPLEIKIRQVRAMYRPVVDLDNGGVTIPPDLDAADKLLDKLIELAIEEGSAARGAVESQVKMGYLAAGKLEGRKRAHAEMRKVVEDRINIANDWILKSQGENLKIAIAQRDTLVDLLYHLTDEGEDKKDHD